MNLSKCFALQGAPYHITSNAVCPGNILTPMGKTLSWSKVDPKTYIPLGRYGTAEAALPGGSIAVGFDAAFTMRAAHFVDLQRDETLFGFHGIQTLMGLIEQAADTETRWD